MFHLMCLPLERRRLLVALLLVFTPILALIGCQQSQKPVVPPLEIEVVEVLQEDVPIHSEWVGTLEGLVNAQIRPRVTGYLFSQHYKDGSFVEKGALMFLIDPRPFQAALDQAKGELAQAEAALGKTEIDVKRYTPLAKESAISQQELDTAVQANLGNKAKVAAAQAAVAQAQLNLGFTKISSPIDGIAGIAQAQIGDLVGPTSLLTTVSTVDPIKVYFPVSEQEYLNYVKEHPDAAERDAHERQWGLELILADGSIYPQRGSFSVADRQVDVKTGTLRLEGLFSNPGNILRPGQFARVRAITATKKGALLVPQRALTELQGSYQVAVVDKDNKVSIRPVKVGERVGTQWIVDEGLKPGERVVAEGTQRVSPGMTVDPKPFKAMPEAKPAPTAKSEPR